MSINSTQKISPAVFTTIQPDAPKRTEKRAMQSSGSADLSGTKVSLSNQIQGLQANSSQDINIAHLDKIKAALAAGELPIDTDKIASSLVQEMFQSI